MSTGELFCVWLLSVFIQGVVWGICDALVHRKDGETFTRWVIKESRKRKSFARGVLAVLLFFQGLLVWLWFHFETWEFI